VMCAETGRDLESVSGRLEHDWVWKLDGNFVHAGDRERSSAPPAREAITITATATEPCILCRLTAEAKTLVSGARWSEQARGASGGTSQVCC
jgi:hypothetical protein